MAVDPQISMQAATAQPNIGAVVNNQQQVNDQSALSAEQTLKAHMDNMNTRDQARLRSSIVGAAQLKTYLDKGDIDGAHEFLVNRQKALHTRMGNGEDVDDQETAYALDKLRRGDIEGLSNDVSALAAAGQAYGMIGGSGAPSSVQEWQYYNSLSGPDQARYIEMKRSNQLIDRGGSVEVVGKGGAPVRTVDKTLAPADQPANAEAKADAAARGNITGTNAANAAASAEGLKGVTTALQNLQTAGKAAPGGTAQNLGAQIANKSGMGGNAADAQGDFTVKRASAENAIREAFRVAGSGAQSDADALPFIQMLPEATDADSVKISKTNAAMQAVEARIRAKLAQAQGGGKPQAPAAPTAPTGSMVKISNGTETFMVSPEDAAAAAAEGFKQVQ